MMRHPILYLMLAILCISGEALSQSGKKGSRQSSSTSDKIHYVVGTYVSCNCGSGNGQYTLNVNSKTEEFWYDRRSRLDNTLQNPRAYEAGAEWKISYTYTNFDGGKIVPLIRTASFTGRVLSRKNDAEKPSIRGTTQLWPPTVTKLRNGTYSLKFSPSQQVAVDKFLRQHPALKPANFSDRNPDYGEYIWNKIRPDIESGEMQFPFAVWGDINRDGFLDIALAFVTKKAVNNWGWREYWIVVFQGASGGQYNPIVATRDQIGCFDGMYYRRESNTVEYACIPSSSGYGRFRWNGMRYQVLRKLGQ